MTDSTYWWWHDPTKARTMHDKIVDAVRAYHDRFAVTPTVAYIADSGAEDWSMPIAVTDRDEARMIEVRQAAFVPVNAVYIPIPEER